MKKFVILAITLILGAFINSSYSVSDDIQTQKNTEISNKLFSVYIPEELKGTYSVKKKDQGIFIYHKASKKAGFGGFAFGIKAYKNPADHAMMPGGRKIGELIGKKSELYDMVLIQPTDVQYDYTKDKCPIYDKLYKLGDFVDIKGVRGAKYYRNQGMLGKDLYNEILNKHILAVKEKWNSSKLEEENMSYMYNILSLVGQNVLDKIGYAYYDVNGDGIEELFFGEIADGSWKGVVYDIYTMVDRKPVHVVSGGSRNRYYVCDDAFLCNEYSSGADESGWLVYILVENSTELYPQVGFKYDGYKNKNNPWFLSYSFTEDKWENVSEELFKERKAVFDKYLRFEYTPLSTFNN